MINEIIEKIKGYLPYIAGLILVSCIIFYPELQGKKLGAHDANSWTAGAKEFTDYKEKGQEIKWTNRIFSGMPLYTMAGSESGNIVSNIYTKVIQIFPSNIYLLFVVMLCCFLSLILLRVHRLLALVLSIAFGLNTWLLDSLWASHPTKILSLAFLFPVISGFIVFMKSNRKIGLLFIMLGLCLSIAYAHYQIVYYGVIINVLVGLFLFYEAIIEKTTAQFFKKIALVLLCVAIGAMTNISALYITNDYNKDTMRGGKTELVKEDANSTAKEGGLDINYAFSWSYCIPELFNFVVPDALGGSSNYHIKSNKSKLAELQAQQNGLETQVLPYYWGIQPFTGAPNYLGAGIIFLFIFSMFYWKNRLKWLFLSLFILSVFMGLGKSFLGFNELLFNHLPLYNKFRTPTMSFSILNLISILTIGCGLSSLLTTEYHKEEVMNALKKSGYVFLGIMIFGFFYVSSQGYVTEQELKQYADSKSILDMFREDRASLLKSDWLRTLFIALIVFGVLYTFIKGSLKSKTMLLIIGILCFIDLYTVYKRYLDYDVFKKVEKVDEMITRESYHDQLAYDKSHFRVFNSTNQSIFNDNTDGYYFSNIGGYSPAKLYRYQDLIDVHLGKGNMPVLNMLNAKYFIVGTQDGQKIPQLNPDACGNAWFVSEVKFAKNANEEMDSIGAFNPKVTAWVDKRFQSETKFNGNSDPNAKIELTQYHPENMVYESNSLSGGFAVFSEIWYRGNEDWNIYIDGKHEKMVRTNYLLRGAYIPSGKHKIEMKFTAKKLTSYKYVGYAASALLILGSILILYASFYRPQKTE